MTIPYRWRCSACGSGNAAGVDICALCGSNAVLSAAEMETEKSPRRHAIAWPRWVASLGEDQLFIRVTVFIVGAVAAAIPIVALLSGVVVEVNDGALNMLLLILEVVGGFLLFASVWGNDNVLLKAVVWSCPGDLMLTLGLVTLAVPITLLINFFARRNHDRFST